MIHDGKTIIACSTGGQANTAIAIIRLSGPFSLTDFSHYFSTNLDKHKPREMILTRLLDGKNTVDEICVCFFRNPASYTGENLLELHVHGNRLNVERIISLFLKIPTIREAQPGEFSLRALQNKKISLSQAEGLDLFLNASSPLALEQGMELLNGDLHESYLAIFESYKTHKAALELLLDFHEDVGEEEAWKLLKQSWNNFYSQLSTLVKRVKPNSSKLLKPEIVIAGLPNAGKSTFFNALLSEERAIVSSVAGTTRDYLAEDISIGGVTYRLLDTAGVRETSDFVESEGIKRTKERIERAFFSILLINPFESNLQDIKRLAQISFDFIFYTHADGPGFIEYKNILKTQGVVLSGQDISLKQDISQVFQYVEATVNKKYRTLAELKPLLLERHKSLILKSFSVSEGYAQVLASSADVGILSHELNDLAHCLQELLGVVSPDEVLDHIFANFCIGK